MLVLELEGGLERIFFVSLFRGYGGYLQASLAGVGCVSQIEQEARVVWNLFVWSACELGSMVRLNEPVLRSRRRNQYWLLV